MGSKTIAPYLRKQLVPELQKILQQTQRADGKPYNLYTDGLRIELTLDAALQTLAEKAMEDHMTALQKQFDAHWKDRDPWKNHPEFLWKEAQKSLRYKRLKKAGKSESEIRKIFNTKTDVSVFTHAGPKQVQMTPLDSIAHHQLILQAGFFAMDAETGEVLAYVGGIDHQQFAYDHIYAKRQVGSVFKPFVYTAALADGMLPCDYIENEPIVFEDFNDWSPQNSGGEAGGYYSMRGGLAKSVNTVAARLIDRTGTDAVIDIAEDFGIESDIPDVPSIALGVANLSLREMVPAYAPFVNGGNKIEPRFIRRVLDSNGNVLYEAKEKSSRQAIDPFIALEAREMLQAVVDSGTARSLRSRYGLRTELGGKTGTTQNNADGWFIGFSPKVVFGAWVGGQSPTVRFRSTALGQGAATALPIAGNWLHAIEKQKSLRKKIGYSFPDSDEDDIDLDCAMYVEEIPNQGLFEDLFNKEKKKEKKKKKEGDGWMKRLINKLGKKKKS